MEPGIVVIGAGVSGLTCAIVCAENGFKTTLLAEQIGDETNSAAAAAIWYPYDVGPDALVVPWALVSYGRFCELARDPGSGVSLIEQRIFSRLGSISPPAWARPFATRSLAAADLPDAFRSGFSITVPLIETGKYLAYLSSRLTSAGGTIRRGRLTSLSEVDPAFDVIVNCAGIGARELVADVELEPHRGQVAVVAGFDLPYAIVCDDPPLMYAIPRSNDCVLGGTNEVSENREARPDQTTAILSEFERVFRRAAPPLLRERVGLRPCRKSGVRVAVEKLGEGRTVIHNYGHGGAGFTLSWGCAQTVLELTRAL